jgi:hypothetical protein
VEAEVNATLKYEGREVTFYGLDEMSHIGNCLINVCWYEEKNLRVIRELQVGGNYVDVGAHIGTHALYFSFFCPSVKVYAFEPKGEYYAQLVKNVQLNQAYEKCKTIQCALVEAQGVQLPVDEGEVWKTATLDSFHLPDVRLLKIDVESSELRVLQGARETLKTVEHLFLEVWTDEVYAERGEESPMAEIIHFLQPYGIRLIRELEWENLWHFQKL